jgi:hypothetical protein
MERLWRGENTNDSPYIVPLKEARYWFFIIRTLIASFLRWNRSTNAEPLDMETNRHRGASALVPVEPIPDNPVSLLRLVPEKTVATALHHREFGVANVIAQMFRGDDMVAGVGIGFIFAAH